MQWDFASMGSVGRARRSSRQVGPTHNAQVRFTAALSRKRTVLYELDSLTPQNKVLFLEANGLSDIQEIPRLCRTQMFITVFARAHHWTLSWARWLQSISSYPIFIRPVLISYHLRLCLSSSFFPSDFPAEIWHKIINPFKPNDKYVPAALTISNSAFCIYIICMVLSINRDYFLIQH
jgi:hypothetical protein